MKEFMDFVFEQLAEKFETPCSFSPADTIMLYSGQCEDDCGDISGAECWKRYFKILYAQENADEPNT